MGRKEALGIIQEYDKLSLEDFFISDDDALLKVITPLEEVNCVCDYHDEGAKVICKALYDTSYGDDYFANFLGSKGCITMQIMKNDFNIIYIPIFNGDYTVNSYQFERLLDYYNSMMGINRKRDEKIELHTNLFDGNQHLSLGRALMYLKRRINDDAFLESGNDTLSDGRYI